MDKQFWAFTAENDYAIPEELSHSEMTKTLFGYLGSIDPELRDEIAYIMYANWLKREMYSKDEIRTHLKKQLLDKEQIQFTITKAVWYLDAEKDPRRYIPVTGWVHALAHTTDLMLVLGKNRFIEKGDLEKLLRTIAKKLIHSMNWVHIHGEDDCLANAVMASLRREMVTTEFHADWVKSFTEPERSWNGAYTDEDLAKVFHNVRNFLRSIFEAIRNSNDLHR
jgi:hypothetical protein